MMKISSHQLDRIWHIGIGLTALIVLYLTSFYNYLLFHSLAEAFSVVIAFTIFIVAWNSKEHMENPYLLILGIAYLFIGFLDLLHTLAYKGMNIFTSYDYYGNQLWIATRYLESITLLVAFSFLNRRFRLRPYRIELFYLVVTGLIILSIFYWHIFPICFIEGEGQTTFKIVSEYIISSILLLTLAVFFKYRARFEKDIFWLLVLSIVFTIFSELAFTFYVSNYGLSNMVGHYLKIASFYLVYKAVVQTGIKRPYDIIFRDLVERERQLERQTILDELTGVYNRRAAFTFLGNEMEIARSQQERLQIGFLDIDNLKWVNDSYGHIEGDRMIRRVAQALSRATREADYVCRVGGDEFLLILPNYTDEEALLVIEQTETYLSEEGRYSIEFSYGFAGYDYRNGQNLDGLIEEADTKMYRQKQAKKKHRLPAATDPTAK